MKTAGTNRRKFLMAAGLGGAGAVAAVVAGKQAVQAPGQSAAAQPQTSGYRATPHILAYYTTAPV